MAALPPNDPNQGGQNPFTRNEVQRWERGHRPLPMSDRDLQRAHAMMQDSIARIRAYEHAASAPDPPSKRHGKTGPMFDVGDLAGLHDELVSNDWSHTNLVQYGEDWLGLTNPVFRSPRHHTIDGKQYPRFGDTILSPSFAGIGQYTFPVPPWEPTPRPSTRAIAEMAPAGWYLWLTDQLTGLLGPTKPFGSSWQFENTQSVWSTSSVYNPTYSGSSYVEDEFQALAAALQSIEDEAKESVTSTRDELPDRYEDYGR